MTKEESREEIVARLKASLEEQKAALHRYVEKERFLAGVKVFLVRQGLTAITGGIVASLLADHFRQAGLATLAIDIASAYFGPIALQAGAVSATFALGTLLYWFRCLSPRWYGTFEIAFGVAGAVYIVNQLMGKISGSSALVFAEAAALYVIVRGYDNIYKSLEVERRRAWNRIFFRLDTEQKL